MVAPNWFGYTESEEKIHARFRRRMEENREQERILQNITAEAQDAWLDEQRCYADEREAQAAEIENYRWLEDTGWMQNGGAYMQGEELGRHTIISGGEVLEL